MRRALAAAALRGLALAHALWVAAECAAAPALRASRRLRRPAAATRRSAATGPTSPPHLERETS